MDSELDLQALGFSSPDQKRGSLVIAGPCSAESQQQVMHIAEALSRYGLGLYRAGIWKPRTRPGDFQGVGSQGLPWLQKVRQRTGMQVAVEVATPWHAEQALAHHMDVMWIGARSTANPFTVEEIARALKGTNIPVLVKNPISPDLSLWIGAMERFNKHGLKKIGAIHRGFSCYAKSALRNPPQWEIPLELKRRIPDLPLIHDPSHTTGDRELLYETAKKALHLQMDGLMIEVHHQPEKALSDSHQQITPQMFQHLLEQLNIEINNEPGAKAEELVHLRQQIDQLDDRLLEIMGQRMQVSQEIAHVKAKHRLNLLQKERWQKLMARRVARGQQKGMSRRFIESVFKIIHKESLERQKDKQNQDASAGRKHEHHR